MLRKRIIPSLQLKGKQLVKSHKFGPATYIGDPINAVKIFNEKEVDEILLLDIGATRSGQGPDYALLEEIASEAFVPLTYGGGISQLEQGRQVLRTGVEKLALNSVLLSNPDSVRPFVDAFGSQAIVAVVDVKVNAVGRPQVYSHSGRTPPQPDPMRWALWLQSLQIGEILIQSVDRDGTLAGYDLDLLRSLPPELGVPVLAAGGGGSVAHMRAAFDSAPLAGLAVGARFVFYGPLRAVLINYLTAEELAWLNELP